jgi:DNA-binding beta-propeller fold protein YncE
MGIGNEQFHSPLGIAVDPSGNVFVVDNTTQHGKGLLLGLLASHIK